MKIAIMTRLLAKRNVNVDAAHYYFFTTINNNTKTAIDNIQIGGYNRYADPPSFEFGYKEGYFERDGNIMVDILDTTGEINEETGEEMTNSTPSKLYYKLNKEGKFSVVN